MLNFDISNIEYQDLIDFVEANISDFKNFEISISFKADYNQSKIIRWFIIYIFDKVNVNTPRKWRFSLLSDELINNSIEHGSSPLDKNLFTLKFLVKDKILYINIEVADTGRWVWAKSSVQMEEIKQQKEIEWFEGFLWKRWRGLFQLVNNIVDDIYFKDRVGWWLIVWVTKKIDLSANS